MRERHRHRGSGFADRPTHLANARGAAAGNMRPPYLARVLVQNRTLARQPTAAPASAAGASSNSPPDGPLLGCC